MLCFPNCKINIGLYITNRRTDGFHDIETIFYPVAINDVLEIIPANVTSLKISGKQISGNLSSNLVLKAYNLLQQMFPLKVRELSIFLHKVIPMGAGLGGGSADGAFMIKLLNDFYNLDLDKSTQKSLALTLGSDCPFFIYNKPQFANGRGEQLEDIEINLTRYNIQIVFPNINVDTGWAFKQITAQKATFDLKNINNISIEDWKRYIKNDFENVVVDKHPEICKIKNELYKEGAIYSSMSGSGSTVYGIFKKGEKAKSEFITKYENFYV